MIKKGEHGAVLWGEGKVFFVPAFPLEDVFDPTGAGDAFAGGFMACVASSRELTPRQAPPRHGLWARRMGSFAVERFSIRRFDEISKSDVAKRVQAYRDLVHFEPEPA